MPDRQSRIESRQAIEYNGTQRVEGRGDSDGDGGRKGEKRAVE